MWGLVVKWLRQRSLNDLTFKARPAHAVGFFVVVTLVLIMISVALLLWNLRKRELTHSRIETVSLARMFIEQTEQSFSATETLLTNVQEKMQNDYGRQFALDSLPIHLLLNTRASGSRQIKSLFVVDASGMVVNTSRDLKSPQLDVTDRAYFKALVANPRQTLYIDKPQRNRIDNSWNLYFAKSILDDNGVFRGVLVATVDIPRFEQLYNFMKLDFLRPISIYMNDGTLVASLPHRENMIGEKVPELTPLEIAQVSTEVGLLEHVSGDGARHAFAIGRVAKFPMLVSVTNDEEEALSSWRETAIPISLGAGITCVFIIIMAALLIRELQREELLAIKLRDATDRYHHTIESVMDAIVAVDDTHAICLFNPAAEAMFGYKAQDMLGRSLSDLIPERLRPAHDQHVSRFMHSDVASRTMSWAPQLEVTGRRSDGTEFPIESTISQTWIGNSKQLTAVLRDATERRRFETDLQQNNQQLRQLSAALQNVREEERARIARELHDELGQQLTGLKLDLSWLANRLKEGREANPDKVLEMRQALDLAIKSVRRISTELRPLILDDLGFAEAVRWQAAEIEKRSGLTVLMDLQDAEYIVDDGLATALFRIVQESLTNVIRHAKASTVTIGLHRVDAHMVLTVCDDGQGLPHHLKQGGIGLVSMRERATAFGGRFSIVNNSEQGATVQVIVPVAAIESREDNT